MKKKILILSGGISKERLISLDTGYQVAKELKKNGYRVKISEPDNNLAKNINKFKVDQFLGEIRNDGEYVNIILRDHEYPDGDLIKVEVNEQIVMPAILLTEKAKGFKLDLKNGFNVVDFVALNQGTSGPNTAEIIVYDDQGKLVGTNRWNLATGVKATYIIYKN